MEEKNNKESQNRIKINNGEEELTVEVIDQTTVDGVCYLLTASVDVETNEDGEEIQNCYVLKDRSSAQSEDALYEFVEDEKELEHIFSLFGEMLEDDYDLEG